MWHNTTYIGFHITASAPSALWFVTLQEDDFLNRTFTQQAATSDKG